jgi:hypothetical protein
MHHADKETRRTHNAPELTGLVQRNRANKLGRDTREIFVRKLVLAIVEAEQTHDK